MQEARALISIIHQGAKDIHVLQEVVRSLRALVSFEKISSVYEVMADQGRKQLKYVSPLGQSICCSAVVIFEGTSKQLNKILAEIQMQQTSGLKNQNLSIHLLSFSDEVSMLPSLTLPHPDLHTRAEFLIPSVEIYPQYRHPILDKDLSEVHNEAGFEGHMVFYAQSKGFSDFS